MKANLLLVALGLAACQGVIPSGNVVSETREVTAFRQVSIGSGIRAQLSAGTRDVELRADDNVAPLVETFVEAETLVVRVKRPVAVGAGRTLEVTIRNDLFEGLVASGGSRVTVAATPVARFPIAASGGSEVTVTGLSCTDLVIDSSGGSDVRVSGAASAGDVTASGGSELALVDVPLASLHVVASGGSRVAARVSGSLTGSASGGSTVVITGTPASSVTTSGGAKVRLGEP